MKVRNGFVSNSSSSSFIIGIVNTGVGGEGEVFDVSKYYNREMPWYLKVKEKDEEAFELSIESFTYSTVSCDIKHGESFLDLHNSGPDGDEYFIVREANGDYLDMDYDKIDIDDFSKEDVATYEKILKLGGQVSYGAGRDG